MDDTIIIVAGLLIAGLGVVMLVWPDAVWAWQERVNANRGQVSERTERWDQGNRVGAVIVLVVGLAITAMGLSL
jgi:hypothetical protein